MKKKNPVRIGRERTEPDVKHKQRKKLLYFMPDNPYWSQSGNRTRTKQMLQYFEDNRDALQVDFLSLSPWTEEDRERFATDYPSIMLCEEGVKRGKKNRIKYFLTDKLPRIWEGKTKKRYIDRNTTPYFRKRIARCAEEGNYDYLLVSYASWGVMAREFTDPKVHKIIDTHDFITIQHREYWGRNFGKAFEEEMGILSLFDEIWTYSVEEAYVFSQFTEKKVRLMPVSFPERYESTVEKEYDLLYVASDNSHNEKSIRWFVDGVLPLLPPEIRLHMVGPVCEVTADHPRLVKLGVVDDLDAVYKKSKVTICPMVSGTGIKIKVLESLSYGLPVVTSRRGVDGLVNKINNGCVLADDGRDFARHVVKLLSDGAYYGKTARQAREFHESFYTREKERAILDDVFGI